jgi:hypothetical protein
MRNLRLPHPGDIAIGTPRTSKNARQSMQMRRILAVPFYDSTVTALAADGMASTAWARSSGWATKLRISILVDAALVLATAALTVIGFHAPICIAVHARTWR